MVGDARETRVTGGREVVITLALAALPLLLLRAVGLRVAWEAATFVPLHTLIEVAIALVGLATFAVQWYAASARGVPEPRGQIVGAAFLGLALLGCAHLLVYPGMPGLFGPGSVERGAYYWTAGRYWLTGTLLVAAFVTPGSDWPLARRVPLVAAALVTVALLVIVELRYPAWRALLWLPGRDLTRARVALEAGVPLLAVAGAALHWRRWRATGDRTAQQLAVALALTVLSEGATALNASVYDLYNLLGHVYALASAALIFDALFVAALLEPYRKLDLTSRELVASNARLDRLRAHVEGELATTIVRLKEASEREQRARADLEAAIAAVPAGIVLYDPTGGIRRTNAAVERLLRYTDDLRDLALEERWARLHPQTTDGKPLPFMDNPVVRALNGETVGGVPVSIETPDGRRRWVSISAAPARIPDANLEGAVAVISDLSTIQELQNQRDDLLRAVSHDLRNPLQISLLQAERLQRLLVDPDRAKERASADRIVHASRQMEAMIRDLVDASRMERALVLAPERVELAPFLRRLLGQAAGAMEVDRVRLELPDELPPVLADPERLERVVLNLIGNALKYSASGTEVQISAKPHAGMVLVAVTDRGVGIDPDDLARVFDRFFRGARTGGADGLGLGLYIVRLFVEAQGGRVWAESRPGEGSTFSITLPVYVRPG